MRIKDLATRTAALLTGNGYFVVDNGTAVQKVNYSQLAKEIIEQYNQSTLAGSSQTLQAALSSLKSETTNITNNSGWKSSGSFNDLRKSGLFVVSGLTDGPAVSGISTWSVLVMAAASITASENSSAVKQVAFVQNGTQFFTRQFIQGAWTDWVSQPDTVMAVRNGIAISSGDDLNNYITVGSYYSESAAITNSLSNCPTTGLAFRLLVVDIGYGTIAYGRQILMTGGATYIRSNTTSSISSPVWSDWVQVPTRSEVNTLSTSLANFSSFKKEYYNYGTSGLAGTTQTITLTSAVIYFLVVSSVNMANTTRAGLYMITPHSINSNILTIHDSEGATVAIDKLTLTIQYNYDYIITALVSVR